MSVQDEMKARWIPGCWRDASEAHIRGDLPRASNDLSALALATAEASSPEDKRIRLSLNAHWNKINGIMQVILNPAVGVH